VKFLIRLFRRSPVRSPPPGPGMNENEEWAEALSDPVGHWWRRYRTLTRDSVRDPDLLAVLPDPMVVQYVIALTQLSLEEWGVVVHAADRFDRSAGPRSYARWVREMGKERAEQLGSVANGAMIAKNLVLMASNHDKARQAGGSGNRSQASLWLDLGSWLTAEGSAIVNRPVGYYATRPFRDPADADALLFPLSEVL
jgi:hypothetical protein